MEARNMRALAALRSLIFACPLLALTLPSHADTISTTLSAFTGEPIEVELSLSDDAEDGTIRATVEIVSGVGDLRGLFLDLSDVSLLPGLLIDGDDVSGFEIGDVINLGQGSNLNGGGSPCPCDIGIVFGSPGIGIDDFALIEFVLSHETEWLSLSLFSEQRAGARVTSVALDMDGSRQGSSKLVGVVPEPGTALLVFTGLTMFGLSRSARS
jgi:hypothetical protein